MIYKKTLEGKITMNNPTKHLLDYIAIQGVILPEDTFRLNQADDAPAAQPQVANPQITAELPAANTASQAPAGGTITPQTESVGA